LENKGFPLASDAPNLKIATYGRMIRHIVLKWRIKMNKGDLVSAVADHANLTKAQAGAAVDAVLDAITATLKSGDEVRLVGFGTFGVSKRAAGTARNPRTGETIATKASNTPKFKAGAGLKASINV
jgi:DNA-binding protein HU-beta